MKKIFYYVLKIILAFIIFYGTLMLIAWSLEYLGFFDSFGEGGSF